jgi:hypothetical protein
MDAIDPSQLREWIPYLRSLLGVGVILVIAWVLLPEPPR